jgi:hypothetical protein
MRLKPYTLAMLAAALVTLLGLTHYGLVQFRDMNRLRLSAKAGGGAGEKELLGVLREALKAYKKDHGGKYPADGPAVLVREGYLKELPELWSGRAGAPHPPSSGISIFYRKTLADTGMFAYINDPKDRDFGQVYIDCRHRSPDGTPWSAY